MKNEIYSRFAVFTKCRLLFGSLVLGAMLNVSALGAATPPPPGSLEKLQSYLKVPIEQASMKALVRAMKAAVAANPDGAADYVEAFMKSGREESCSDTAKIIAAAIGALGENPPANLVTAIVQRAVVTQPKCAPAITAAAVKAAPADLADEIVEVAVASVPNPEQMVGNVTLAEAILTAALEARPDLDSQLLANAADRGLGSNLSSLLAGALPSAQGTQAKGELGGVAAYQKNPNITALLIAEDAKNPQSASLE